MSVARFEFRRVSKNYEGQAALTDVSFTLFRGDHTAIIGLSGCGKSTTLRLLAGLEAPSSGEIHLDGVEASRASKITKPTHLRGVAMVFQDLALWPNLSIMDNVLLGLSGHRLAKQAARARAARALTLCGVESLRSRKPGTISGGQQQRAALARAIAVQPDFLFLDEPFSDLDPLTKCELLQQISALAAEQKFTIILVTHDPMEAVALCDSAIVLTEGRVEESGIWTDLLKAPRSPMLRIFREQLSGLPSI